MDNLKRFEFSFGALFFLDHANYVLPHNAPNGVKYQNACDDKYAPNPMCAFKIKPEESTDHNGIKCEGVEETPHGN